jgi:hypothetical protein
MMTMPSFLQEAGIAEAPLKFSWNDKMPSANYGQENHRLERQLAKVSDRGVIALGAVCAEWVLWRFSKVSDTGILNSYIEAVWASLVDWLYLNPKMSPRYTVEWKDWQGKERGPIGAAAILLANGVNAVMRPEPAVRPVASLANLVELVVTDLKAFRNWRNWALDRLIEIDPYDDDQPIGVPVPREALDPTSDFKPEMSQKLIDQFLQKLDYKKNRYLRSPQELKKAGFTGTPYRYGE